MNSCADEMADLRQALLAGDWSRLDDPRLELAILEEPAAWLRIVRACAVCVTLDALQSNDKSSIPFEIFTWHWDEGQPEPENGRKHAATLPRRPEERVVRRLIQMVIDQFPDHERTAASLRLARRVLSRWPRPKLDKALVVLERWPAC